MSNGLILWIILGGLGGLVWFIVSNSTRFNTDKPIKKRGVKNVK